MGLSFTRMAELVDQHHWDYWQIFPDELILAIFWEESTFTNARQIGWKQGAVGFGQVEPSTVTLANLWAQRDYPSDCTWTPADILVRTEGGANHFAGVGPLLRSPGKRAGRPERLRRRVELAHSAPLDPLPRCAGGDERLQRHRRGEGGPQTGQAQFRPGRCLSLSSWSGPAKQFALPDDKGYVPFHNVAFTASTCQLQPAP